MNLPDGAENESNAPWLDNYTCPNCAEDLEEDEYVCPSCGFEIGDERQVLNCITNQAISPQINQQHENNSSD
jgi:uncharacterized membrane protein YvbJ